jgi:GIY-YIG catalytic domain-containing protein
MDPITAGPSPEMTASVCTALSAPRHTLLEAAGNVPGLYAIYGDPAAWLELGLGNAPPGAALYVGKTEAAPLRSVRTAQSTVRRSFAALLRAPLALRGIPRNQTKPERLSDFALSEEHDVMLTEWMDAHLEIAVWTKPPECAVLGEIEVAVLKRWSPPLNLRDNRSTWGALVSAAHKLMASDARTWAREHGHRL